MMTLLTLVFLTSLGMFIVSLAAAMRQGETTAKTYQYLMAQTMSASGNPMHASFDRAARRPIRVLGSFIM